MQAKGIVKLEGLAVFLASSIFYFYLGGSIWLYLVLALAPDLSMVGYLKNARVGSYVYNLFHNYVIPLVLLVTAMFFEQPLLIGICLIWIAHIGMDRLCGFGLKYPTAFSESHMNQI
ncbi:DUF4260 domain-containing protein [Shouchella patagoniensis]|uniref:DUF4260 domain-containing protein n=1 Tax=Shouchella patagoniensis TaxID=228576 RepID=UPI000995929A|nr:DUF4260 domain-containing protein [Shouchella patagoniensis]